MYKTFEGNVNSEQVIKKSRFIALGNYVSNEAQVIDWLKEIKAQFYDAKHIAYAYRLNDNGQIYQKCSDDGEPSGTAGKPILNLIINDELMNVVIAVVRYFGGIKLGASGLIRAYIGSAKLLNKFYITKLNQYKVVCEIENADKFIKYLNNKKIHYSKSFEDKLYVTMSVENIDEILKEVNYIYLKQ